MCENKEVKVLLESGNKKIDLKIEGFRNTKSLVKQLCDMFVTQLEDDEILEQEKVQEVDMEEVIKNAYSEVNNAMVVGEDVNAFKSKKLFECTPLTVVSEEEVKPEINNEIDYETEFNNTDMEKYNREFPRLKTAVERNLYNKLTELQINKHSFFVTEKGELKLQACYSCKCGNFQKVFIVYPDGKKSVRCNVCHKPNNLVSVKGTFPCTDIYGNFYATSNAIKRIEEKAKKKEQEKEGTYITMF